MKLFPTTTDEIREPGLYYDITDDEYRGIPALSQSTLKLLDEERGTPLHARAVFERKMPDRDSRAMRLGRAVHSWILDGHEEFHRRFCVASVCAAKTKSGTACKNGGRFRAAGDEGADPVWYCGTHKPSDAVEGGEFVSEADFRNIAMMEKSITSHEINAHLSRPGWSEATIVYDVAVPFAVKAKKPNGDPTAKSLTVDLRHKVRFDRVGRPTKNKPWVIIDIKKMAVNEGRRVDRERAINRYGWDVQAAMYSEALMMHYGVNDCDYIWLFVEDAYPFDVVWFPASNKVLRIGRDKLWRYRKLWAVCEETGEWPGRCVGPQQPGGLPSGYIDWYMSSVQNGGWAYDENGTLLGDKHDVRTV